MPILYHQPTAGRQDKMKLTPLASIGAFLLVLAVGAFFQWIGLMTAAYVFYGLFALGILAMLVLKATQKMRNE